MPHRLEGGSSDVSDAAKGRWGSVAAGLGLLRVCVCVRRRTVPSDSLQQAHPKRSCMQ